MKTDWREYCRAAGFTSITGGVEVRFTSGRSQKVTVEDHDDTLLMSSIVARPSVVAEISDAALRAWVRNRSVSLVGFRVDHRGRLLGEAWVPRAGITAKEFQFILHHVAVECDRFEFQLTGKDQE